MFSATWGFSGLPWQSKFPSACWRPEAAYWTRRRGHRCNICFTYDYVSVEQIFCLSFLEKTLMFDPAAATPARITPRGEISNARVFTLRDYTPTGAALDWGSKRNSETKMVVFRKSTRSSNFSRGGKAYCEIY